MSARENVFSRYTISASGFKLPRVVLPAITYTLVNINDLVVFQISEQWRLPTHTFRAGTGFHVLIAGSLELNSDSVYVRGASTSYHTRAVFRRMDNAQAAESYMARVHKALEEWNINAINTYGRSQEVDRL